MQSSSEPLPEKAARRFYMYPVWSLAALTCLPLLLPLFAHWPKRGSPYYDAGAAVLGILVSGFCLWTFLRSPFRHWFVKLCTFVLLVIALYADVLIVWNMNPP
jgi:hypothetical protein